METTAKRKKRKKFHEEDINNKEKLAFSLIIWLVGMMEKFKVLVYITQDRIQMIFTNFCNLAPVCFPKLSQPYIKILCIVNQETQLAFPALSLTPSSVTLDKILNFYCFPFACLLN